MTSAISLTFDPLAEELFSAPSWQGPSCEEVSVVTTVSGEKVTSFLFSVS